MPEKSTGMEAFALAINQTFGTGCSQQLKDWKLPIAMKAGNDTG